MLNAKKGTSHKLPLSRKFFFRVMKARKGLADGISGRIRSWLIEGKKSAAKQNKGREDVFDDGTSTVPISIVDDLIKKDYMEGEMTQTHTIYLLNPKRVKMSEVEGKLGNDQEHGAEKPVFKEGEDERVDGKDDSVLRYWYNTIKKDEQRKGFSCGTTMWAGVERCVTSKPVQEQACGSWC